MRGNDESRPEPPLDPAPFRLDVCVVGGCGHVGLPLSLAFAERGMRVGIYDIDDGEVRVTMTLSGAKMGNAKDVFADLDGVVAVLRAGYRPRWHASGR